MAFGSVGTLGTAASSGNNQTSLALTTSAAAEAGNLVVVLVAVDNNQTTDGDSTAVSDITDSAGGNTWTRAKGFANGQGTNQAGADISIWYSRLVNEIPSGGTITASFTTSATSDATAMTAWEFTAGAGFDIEIEGTPGGLANDGANAGSLDVTTANIECLRVRGIASESNSTTALVETSSWTLFSQAVSGAGTSATEMGVRGEHRIATGTSFASAPTGGAGAVDHASAYVAFKEVAGTQTVSPSLFSDDDTFFAPALTTQTQASPSLFGSETNFFAPSVSATFVASPGLHSEAAGFFVPTISAAGGGLGPYINENVIFGPSISMSEPVFVSLFSNESEAYQPAFTGGAVRRTVKSVKAGRSISEIRSNVQRL